MEENNKTCNKKNWGLTVSLLAMLIPIIFIGIIFYNQEKEERTTEELVKKIYLDPRCNYTQDGKNCKISNWNIEVIGDPYNFTLSITETETETPKSYYMDHYHYPCNGIFICGQTWIRGDKNTKKVLYNVNKLFEE